MANGDITPDKLSIIVYDGHFDKVHYALVLAAAASAVGRPVTLFFTMGACRALMKPANDGQPAWRDSRGRSAAWRGRCRRRRC